jgi:multiple sugar transport system ATP-binding protein
MELYNRPANEFVASFIGAPRINLIPRPAASGATAVHRALWRAVAGQASEGVLRAGLRPEHLHLAPAGQGGANSVAASVVLAEHLGDASIIHLRVDGISDLLVAKVGTENAALSAGQSVGLVPDAAWALAFGADGRLVH